MKSQETQHFKSLNEGKQMYAVDAFSPEDAKAYAAKLFKLRVEGWGDENRALDDCASMSRMTPLSFKRLMTGKTKEPTIGALARVRSAYLAYCERLVGRLQHEIEIEKRKHGDAHFEELGAEAASLMAKVQAAKERSV